MTKIKNYNGVDIYVNSNGIFYCDPVNNSGEFKEKKFHSEKMGSVEKAIDDYEVVKVDTGLYFYTFADKSATIIKLTVINKLGNRLFFNDGTNSADYNRKNLYPSSIENQLEFEEVRSYFSSVELFNAEINRLTRIKNDYQDKARASIKKLNNL